MSVLWDLLHCNHIISNKKDFISFFSVCIYFFAFFILLSYLELSGQCWIGMVRENTLFSSFMWKVSSVILLSMILAAHIFCRCSLSSWENSPLFLVLITMGVRLFKCFFCITWCAHIIFILEAVNVVIIMIAFKGWSCYILCFIYYSIS